MAEQKIANSQANIIKMTVTEMQVAAAMAGPEDSTFAELLEKAVIYYYAGLTPTFLYDIDKSVISITSLEALNRNYH